ncbi:CarD family transcriptional regulator OS=Streptomyces antimycoticus OX=68175 GN=fnr-1 PE=4 SV=1 [Streptomyces antimycoticus]
MGDQAAVDHGSRSATVTALCWMEAVVVSGDRFRAYLQRVPSRPC